MTGHFCTAVSSSGFWQGLWDGFTAPISLVAGLFFNVSFFDVCAQSWWYNCMFLTGVFISSWTGLSSPLPTFIVFVICLIAFLIWLAFANIFYIAAFAVLCVCIVWLAKRFV